jgi:hypothetical protein
MEHSPQVDIILETIRKENRRTQLVFGIGIITLAVVLMVIAPLAIRPAIQNYGTAQDQDFMYGPQDAANAPASTATTTP